MNIQFRQHLGITVSYLLLMIIYSPVSFSSDETGISGVKKLIEQIESGDTYNLPAEDLTHKIDQAKKILNTHLKSHQKDFSALILSARLGIIEELVKPAVISKGNKSSDPRELFVSQHINLDRALKLQPNSAEANYWKARLYGIQPPTINEGGRLEKKAIDLDKAIEFSKKAVQLDSENVAYREALALYLIEGLHRKEALEVMNTAATESHPINVLLKDIDAFPLPGGTIFSKEDSESFGEMQMMRGRITNFPQLRVQVFIVPMYAAKVERFYKQRWPKFKFIRQGSAGPFVQYMKYGERSFIPAKNMSELIKWAGKIDGILLTLDEVRKATKAQQEETPAGHPLPSALGEEFSYMFYVNHRRIE